MQDNKTIQYVSITAPHLKNNNSSFADFRSTVALQAQGMSVLIYDNLSSIEGLVLLATIFEVSDELVLSLSDKRKVLVFEHRFDGLERPSDIVLTLNHFISNFSLKFKETLKERRLEQDQNVVQLVQHSTKDNTLVLDFEAIYNMTQKIGDLIPDTIFFLENLQNFLDYSSKIIIKGEVPLLVAISGLYCIRPYAFDIVLEAKNGSTITLFKK